MAKTSVIVNHTNQSYLCLTKGKIGQINLKVESWGARHGSG